MQFSQPRDNVFAWSDNKSRLPLFFDPGADGVFLIRSANGIGIGTDNPSVKGVDVNGMIQIGDEDVVCNADTAGTMKFQEGKGDQAGCFCSCNGSQWVAMSPSKNCIKNCPAISSTPVNGQCGTSRRECIRGQTEIVDSTTWKCRGLNG